jgi:hypothetical protein
MGRGQKLAGKEGHWHRHKDFDRYEEKMMNEEQLIDEFYAHPELLPDSIENFVPSTDIDGYVEKYLRIAYEEDGIDGLRWAAGKKLVPFEEAMRVVGVSQKMAAAQ